MIPLITPIIIALHSETYAHPAVIATKPDKTPLIVILGSALPNLFKVIKRATVPPLAADNIVLMAIGARDALEASYVLPALKANQPNHKINAPDEANGILLGANTFVLPSELNLPFLDPSRFAIAKATNPPSE